MSLIQSTLPAAAVGFTWCALEQLDSALLEPTVGSAPTVCGTLEPTPPPTLCDTLLKLPALL